MVARIDPLPLLWPPLLLALAAYLVALGAVALARPALARAFLAGFARTPRANAAEAALRTLAGLAVIGIAPRWGSDAAVLAGLFLVLTALAMLAFPDAHRALAARSVAAVAGSMRWLGAASLLMGIGLAALVLAPALSD